MVTSVQSVDWQYTRLTYYTNIIDNIRPIAFLVWVLEPKKLLRFQPCPLLVAHRSPGCSGSCCRSSYAPGHEMEVFFSNRKLSNGNVKSLVSSWRDPGPIIPIQLATKSIDRVNWLHLGHLGGLYQVMQAVELLTSSYRYTVVHNKHLHPGYLTLIPKMVLCRMPKLSPFKSLNFWVSMWNFRGSIILIGYIGILLLACNNPHIISAVVFHPPYNSTNRGFDDHLIIVNHKTGSVVSPKRLCDLKDMILGNLL